MTKRKLNILIQKHALIFCKSLWIILCFVTKLPTFSAEKIFKEFKIALDAAASSLKSVYFIVFIALYNCRCKSLWYNEQSCYKTKTFEYLLYRSLTVLAGAANIGCLCLVSC